MSRETVHRWLRENFQFIAAVNRGKRDLRDAASARLPGAWNKAADNVAAAVESGDLKTSLLVLRLFAGTLSVMDVIAGDDAEKLAEDAKVAAVEEQSAASIRRLLAGT